MTPEHVILLGDLKGTKSYLTGPSLATQDELSERLATMHRAFARLVLGHIERSRTMSAYCFSDSVLVRWDDATEGARFAPVVAYLLWQELQAAGLRFRIFIDCAPRVPVGDAVGSALETTIGRYHHVIPVSLAAWSVFVAEESHFPDGVFIGKDFAGRLRLPSGALDSTEYEAGPFRSVQLLHAG